MRHRVGSLDELEPGTARRLDVDGHRIAVVRCRGESVFAVGDECTHEDISLSEGEVDCDEATVECWKHGSLFSLTDGVPLSLPATKPTPVYEVVIVDGDVFVVLSDGEASS